MMNIEHLAKLILIINDYKLKREIGNIIYEEDASN